jgi:hypothetical protein
MTGSFEFSTKGKVTNLLADITYGTSHSLVGLDVDQREFSVLVPVVDEEYSVTLQARVANKWVFSEEVPVTK